MSLSVTRGLAAVSVAALPFFADGCRILDVLIAYLTLLALGSPGVTSVSDDCPAKIICPVPYCRVAIQNGSFERGPRVPGTVLLQIEPLVWRRHRRNLIADHASCSARWGLSLHDRDRFNVNGVIEQVFQVIDLAEHSLAGPAGTQRRIRAVASFDVKAVSLNGTATAALRLRVFAFEGINPDSFPDTGDPSEFANQATALYTAQGIPANDTGGWQPVELTQTLPDGVDVLVLALDVVFEGDPSEVGVSVDGVNLVIDAGPFAPAAASDHAVAKAGVPVIVDVLENDSDPDAPVDATSLEIVVTPDHGSASPAGGVITYTAADGFIGTDNLSYRFTDADGLAAGALVTIDVVENAPPTAVRDVYALPVSGVLNVASAAGVLSNDMDTEGDALTAEVVDQPRFGTLTSFETDGSFEYQSGAEFAGSDWFSYRVSDGSAYSSKAYVYVEGNRPPMAFPDVFHVVPGTIDTLDVLYNDSDPEGDALGISFVGQTATGNVAITSDDKVRFEAPAGFGGVVAFPYVANDGRGGAAPAAEVQVHVSSVPPYDLGVTATAAPDTIFFGQTVVYEVTVTNNGPQDAGNVVVSFPLPPSQFDIVEIQVTQGFVDPSWNVGSLAAGQTATMTATVEPLIAPLVIRNARITSGLGAGDDHRNNTARAALVVRVD